jgi:predicted DNA-binding WGR domain protein
MTARRFVLKDGGSDKFWEVSVDGVVVTVHWGRTGTKGRELKKVFDTPALAAEHAERMIRDKIAGGYAESRDGVSAGITEELFWSLIALLDGRRSGDDEAVVAPLTKALARRPIAEIQAFDDLLAEKLHALDGEAWAREAGENAFTGTGSNFHADTFLFARAAVVVNGRALYEAVLANPKLFPKDLDFEPILYVATQAYEEKTGQTYEHAPGVNYETFANWPQWPSLQRAN